MALTRHQKNAIFGRPGTVKPVAVQDRMPWLPRTSAGKVQVVLAHPLIAGVFIEACRNAKSASSWVPQRCDSLSIRSIRGREKGWYPGGPNTSNHSWSTAFDFFATRADVPPPGGVWTPHNGVPASFAEEFEELGFTWGGRWTKRKDTPHIEWSKRAPSEQKLDELNDWLDSMVKLGETGKDAATVQAVIRMLGVPVKVAGLFGPQTKSAVQELQALAGLEVDGLVGPATERAMFAMLEEETKRNPGAVVARLYWGVLNRGPSDKDRRFWVDWLGNGRHALDMFDIFWESDEAKILRALPIPGAAKAGEGAVPEEGDVGDQLESMGRDLIDIASRV